MENERNTIAGNVVVQIIGRMIVLIMSLVTIKLISNYVGTEGTGYYNTIITYLSFFITIADFGLFSIGVREIAKYPEKRRALLNNIFTIRLISALAITIIAVIIAQLTGYPTIIKQGVLIASLFLFLNLVGSIFDIIFQTRLEMKKVTIAEIVAKIVSLSALTAVVIFKLDFNWIIATISLATIVTILIKYFLATTDEIPHFGWDPKIAGDIIKLSLPFGMIFILNNFYFKVDTLILFYFKGASDVGIYAVAYRVLETTMFAAAYLAYSLKPLLSATINNDKEKAGRATSSGITFMISMALVLVTICLPFSREIMIFLSNSTFLSGAPVIIVLSIAAIFIYLNTMLSEVLIAKDSRKYLLLMAVIVLTFNVVSNIILIPLYSFYAAGATTLASEILLFCLGYFKTKKIIPIRIDLLRIAKLIFSAAISITLGIFLRQIGVYFILAMIVSTSLYLLLAYQIDAMPKELIREYLSSIKNKWTNQNSQ
ncbi:MAG: flippase [Candidatus Berkelbacteria bacterium]|nr:flippase [Candidatus Berkelbacteria bacterium]